MGDVLDEAGLLTWAGTALPWWITRLERAGGRASALAVPPAAGPPSRYASLVMVNRW